MKGYKVVTKIQLRFRDLDAIGHVNAPVYFSYLELGRLEMFNRMAGKKMKLQEIDFIVGRLEGDYLAPVVLGDELTLGTRLVSLGRTSCVVEQLLEANGKTGLQGAGSPRLHRPGKEKQEAGPRVCARRGGRIHDEGRLMLKLRQLEVQGFKSFVDKTKIELKEDLLIVVGPNGSGKSNIADCILWAIGEQSAKSLRGAKMQDVIFHGTKKRPAAGSAEVFLLFEKEDGQKIRVGRRLNRNGDSSYVIDDSNVRLKDIHEFCYRNNISVQGSYLVEQGRVEKMLALSPQERKSLFEEVAGIAHYKESRKTSESKLNSTKQDLLRVSDIIVEVEAEQAELKKQL